MFEFFITETQCPANTFRVLHGIELHIFDRSLASLRWSEEIVGRHMAGVSRGEERWVWLKSKSDINRSYLISFIFDLLSLSRVPQTSFGQKASPTASLPTSRACVFAAGLGSKTN